MIEFENTRNPILPLSIHIPDGEAHVMPDGNLYIYGSYDDQNDVFCSDKYHIVSTENLHLWKVHDVALRGQDIKWFNNPDFPKYPGIDWEKPTPFIRKMLSNMDNVSEKEKFENKDGEDLKPLLFAPDAIYKNGRYYLYFCMSDDSEGVAVSDKPTGPFENPVQLPCGGIDPAVFIDEDGTAYYYWGQLFSHGVKLNDDMISFDREKIVDDLVTEEEHFFHEGSSMRKIGDQYYLIYSNMQRGKPTSLGYAVSKSPLGPFEYKGIIIDNANCDPSSWNNHGSIEKFNNQWYVFYHRCSRGVQQYRRLCIEPITINNDGTIDEVKMTSQGVGAPFKKGEPIMGYNACELHGASYIGTSHCNEEKITNISENDQLYFRYIESSDTFEKIEIEASGSGLIKVYFNDIEAGTIRIQEGKQLNTEINCIPGKFEIRFDIIKSELLEIYQYSIN
ncbi:family 43 glycosylhydrolase [Candidatus Enterococcus murrayae]|uniref:Family 43 glycosylhydrolase n=1 Tax=Candidatus Enterococcus murrayae TaxID=2815321 RepID=A0ABS3HHC8_9ENTE|nr:family 43 glycosylhydrolase [Enterococcus sp. MJM16]MBO0452857.1 family 43 glycosylhydrolase [Enterococcus sp. MJM16]